MANELRIRRNFLYGTLVSAFINVGDVSITDASFSVLPVVPATAHMAITFEDIASHAFEVMYVIAHVAGSSTITVKRAQEGTVQSTWGSPLSKWVHCPTQRDWQGVGNNDQKQFREGTNYPQTYTPVGSRNIVLTASAGDVVELSYSVVRAFGGFYFDFWTLVGGKRLTQCSTKMYSSAYYASFQDGLPGSNVDVVSFYADVRNVTGFHNALDTRGATGSWLYPVQAADVAANGTATFSWYCRATPAAAVGSGAEQFNTSSGDGYNQGPTSPTGSNVFNRLQYGVVSARNHGPRLYPG